MSRRRDAVLASLVLGSALVAAAAVGAPLDAVAVIVGAGGTLVAEAILSRRRRLVRRVWDRPRVQLAAVGVAFGGTGVATIAVGPRALTALIAGLVTYLGVLAVAAIRSGGADTGTEG